jgi:hypothetical protein
MYEHNTHIEKKNVKSIKELKEEALKSPRF